jgi:peptidyl-prolyl cis-trans isomerase SurA
MKRYFVVLLIGLMSLSLLTACGGSSSTPSSTPTDSGTSVPSSTTGSQSDSSNGQQVVARVNGEEITQAQFDSQFAQLEASYAQQGVPFPTGEDLSQVRQQVVQQLIDQTLVLQETKTRNIIATPQEIDAQYQQTLASFPDEETFNQAMEAEGMTEAELRTLIADSIKANKLFDIVIQEAELSPPTDEELHALYDQASQQQELPAFEEERDQLEAYLVDQEQSGAIQSFVQDLEAKSTIEILMTM